MTPRTTIPLAVAFLAAIVAFIGSTFVAQHSARGIDRYAVAIAADAAPGIVAISGARAEMRTLQALIVQRVAGTAVADQDIATARERLDDRLSAALGLPVSDGESQLLGAVNRSMRAFDEVAERTLTQVRLGRRDEARASVTGDLRHRANEADKAATELVEFDARGAEEAALHIEAERQRANRFAYELDAVSALLAIAAAFFAVRTVRDVHRVQEEHRRLSERKAEELEQFAGRVAHDVLSPLSAVGLSLAMAERLASPGAREALVRGESSLLRVRRIVEGLLDFARSGAKPALDESTEIPPIAEGLRDELAQLAAQQTAELRIDTIDAGPVACSAGVLLSLLSNLMRNALKYLGESPERRVTLRVTQRRARVLFEVEDTGPGIPVAERARIFEPYIRGKHPGTPGIGLGLATVKRLVQAHGGTLGVRAATPRGAIFWFDLPSARPPDAMPQDAVPVLDPERSTL